MSKRLISSSGEGGYTSNCGYSGLVPVGEEWYAVLVDNIWGSKGEHLVGTAGQTVTVSQCYNSGVYIGYANDRPFHCMRKYAVDGSDTPDSSTASYDCVNGTCVDARRYNTPGFFKSLLDCQKICAFSCGDGKQCVDPISFCPPGKICLDSSEYGEIQRMISRIRENIC